MKLLTLIPIILTKLLMANSYLDLHCAIDPYDLRGQTRFDLSAPHVFFHQDGSLIFTPEASVYTNSNVELGFSLAKKHQWGEHIVGTHVFYDRSHISGNSFHQTGIGAVYSTDRFDFTTNYYHPLTKVQGSSWDAVTPTKWVDTEMLLKTPYFHVGTGPIYNIQYKHFALHSRLVVPTKHCMFSVGGVIGEGGYSQGFFSVSFNLMKNGEITPLSTPISRTKKCSVAFYSSDVKKAKKLEKYAKQVEKDVVHPRNVDATAPAVILADQPQGSE